MSNINVKTITNVETVGLSKLRQIFSLTSALADLTEEILEEQGDYQSSFRQGLQKSINQARSGKVRKLQLLSDLV
ncbi:MAG: hypothetical protein AAB657_01600 [Patescibacteria group bacterium]